VVGYGGHFCLSAEPASCAQDAVTRPSQAKAFALPHYHSPPTIHHSPLTTHAFFCERALDLTWCVVIVRYLSLTAVYGRTIIGLQCAPSRRKGPHPGGRVF
jgi:hypothetical protein